MEIEIALHAVVVERVLRSMYDEKDDNTQVLYFKNGVATFSSFGAPAEVVEF